MLQKVSEKVEKGEIISSIWRYFSTQKDNYWAHLQAPLSTCVQLRFLLSIDQMNALLLVG